MKLHELKRSNGLTNKSQRVGRGNSSRYGNYSRKGLKGQKARSGGGVHSAFEGGQTPLFMRLPKLKGFKRYFKLINDLSVVNVGRLDKDTNVTKNTVITKQWCIDNGYAKSGDLIKILGKGEISKAITFDGIDAVSPSAKAKIEKAGGSIK